MRREPPDILITTPESLYLMLTSQAREMFRGVEAVIVDEIHAVAATKRGAHLALTLERLAALNDDRDPQRIGLSATQNPLEEVGRFMVGPRRTAKVVDAGVRKPLDLQIHVPVESMVEPDQSTAASDPLDPLDPLAGGEATRRSIWPAIYPELLALVREHRSTIVFVNNRRGAERLALRLNELAEEDIARAHHGSLAREERVVVEEMLKAGELPCLVATSSLELGIDMGAVDLVLQVESPKSVSRGLQRIGRAGHHVGDVSKGRIFPKFRADLLECAVVAKLMREGRDRADRRAAQPARRPRPADRRDRGVGRAGRGRRRRRSTPSSRARTPTPSCRASCSRTSSTCSTAAIRRRSSASCARGSCGTASPGRSARARARASSRSPTPARSPTAACSPSCCPDGRRVGELDEEMVYEARPGQTFLLGASSWRIEDIGRDRVIVSPAPGVPGAVPFWKGDGVGRPKELGREIGAFSRWAVDQTRRRPSRSDYDLDPLAAKNLLDFLARAAGGHARRAERPHDRRRALPRRDRRLAAVRPQPVRRARPRRLGARAQRADPRRVRPRVRRDLVRRRHHRPPPRRRRAARRRPRDARAGRDRGRRRRRAVLERAVRRALPRERRPRAADPARLPRASARRCGSSG